MPCITTVYTKTHLAMLDAGMQLFFSSERRVCVDQRVWVASVDQEIEGMEVVGDQITVKFAVHRP